MLVHRVSLVASSICSFVAMIIGFALLSIAAARRRHIGSIRVQCIGITLLYGMSASFLATRNDTTSAVMHTLFHIGAFGTDLERRSFGTILRKMEQKKEDPEKEANNQPQSSLAIARVGNEMVKEKRSTEKPESLEQLNAESLRSSQRPRISGSHLCHQPKPTTGVPFFLVPF